ncbi:MAG: YncE family protein [Rikenellaceae bacterium]|nr:YncE family protein [Rikenellaceae bacterium]
MKKIFLFAAALLAFACAKDGGNGDPGFNLGTGVFVCNQGTFTSDDASLSFYDPAGKTVVKDLFYDANGFPLGNVCQSMAIRGNEGFVVVNNSGKVQVINTTTGRWIATIDGLTSPRYVHFVSDTKAYVSDMYSKSITVINPQTHKVTGSILAGRGTEQMAQWGDYVFAASYSYNNQIYRIDTRRDEVVDSVTVAKQPNSVAMDRNGKLWVLSDGGYDGSPYGQEMAALTRIDAATFTVEQVFPFTSMDASPTGLTMNGTRDVLYYVNGSWNQSAAFSRGVFRMNVTATELPADPFIPEGTHLFFGLGVHPATSEVYVSDALDYQQAGIIYRYNTSGALVDEFRTAICPGAFCFKTGN